MSDRVREFELGPEQARSLYQYGQHTMVTQREGRLPPHIKTMRGLGGQIGGGIYKRADVQKRMADEAPPELPMRTGAWRKKAEPHEQTEEQFEKDPRTWFHGEYRHADEPDTGSQSWRSGGFHVGSLNAATDRLTQIGPGFQDREHKPGESSLSFGPRPPGRIFAGRIHDRVRQPLVGDMGDSWVDAPHTRLYENDSEHKGSISAVLPSRNEFRTHQEAIHEHLMAHDDPQAALEALHPRVRAEYLARGGSVSGDRHEALLADLEGRPAGEHPNVGRQFSTYQTFEHPHEVAERPKTHEQLSMLHDVSIGEKVSRHLTHEEFAKFDTMLSTPGAIKATVSTKKQKAF